MRSLGDSDPRQVGPYRSLAGLDSDEMGPLLLASATDGRLVAVKVVSAHLVDDGLSQRLRQSTRVTPVVDVGAGWVASEFLPGPSLRQVVERGVLLGGDSILLLAAGLVGALAELHRAGVVHRDLTPVNVVLTEDSVRVFDFGIARALDRDVSQVVGAAEFMSPEQAAGQPVTPASDVFALGCLLHLAATGRRLFAGESRAETLALVARAQPDLSPSLPAHLHRLIAACLAREPQVRPTLDQVAAMIGPIPPGPHPWPPLVQSLIAEQRAEVAALQASTVLLAPVVVAPAPPPRRPRKEPERWKPDMWAVVSGAAVLIAIVFAIVMFNALTPDRPLREASAPTTTTTTTAATTTTTTTTTTTQEFLSGEVKGLDGKCMDIAGANAGNGTPVQLYACNGTDAQQWEFSDGTVQSLGKCLDVAGGATNDGATVQIYDCNGTDAQQWGVTPDGLIINGQSGKCLDVPGSATADGTQLIIWACHGEGNQRWTPPA